MKIQHLATLALVTVCCACSSCKGGTQSNYSASDSLRMAQMRDSIIAAERQHLADSLAAIELQKQIEWPKDNKEELKQRFYKAVNDIERETDKLEYAICPDFDHDGNPDYIVRNFFAEDYGSDKIYYTSVLLTLTDSVRIIAYDQFKHDMTIFDGGKVSVRIQSEDDTDTSYVSIHHSVKNGKIEKTVQYQNMNVDYVNDTIHYKNLNYQPLFQ